MHACMYISPDKHIGAFVHVCVSIYVCLSVCMHVCMHVYMHACMYIGVCVCVCVCVCVYANMCIDLKAYSYLPYSNENPVGLSPRSVLIWSYQ